MDYLDPAKEARHRIILFVGYILIAAGIVVGALILVNRAAGYGLNNKGVVIQNGLAYFSSQPNPAKIYINGQLNPSATNTRLYLPGGIYHVSLSRAGYDDWQRTIELDGGSVEHFDYPLLIPKTITTNKIGSYASAPTIVTQSPDKRWLVVGKPDSFTDFDVYDLKNPTKAPVSISLPASVVSSASSSQSWQLEEWADDNSHILLQHLFDGKSEYILVDRPNPDQSVNLNTNLALSPTKLTLRNKKFDQYYVYDAASQDLQEASLQNATKTPVLQHVLAYQSYGGSTILYVTNADAPAGKVWLRMLSDGKIYTLHSLPTSSNYVVDLTTYSDTMYVAAGASNASKVYIYKDPLGQLSSQPNQAVTPIQVLHVDQPNYLSFSNNAQFIVAENGSQFGVYDILNQQGYIYSAAAPDSPQPHALWMDGDRLNYVNGGKLFIFDYDHTNQHSLVPASSQFPAAFAPNYKYVYTIAQNPNGQFDLSQTWLLAPADR